MQPCQHQIQVCLCEKVPSWTKDHCVPRRLANKGHPSVLGVFFNAYCINIYRSSKTHHVEHQPIVELWLIHRIHLRSRGAKVHKHKKITDKRRKLHADNCAPSFRVPYLTFISEGFKKKKGGVHIAVTISNKADILASW